MLGMADDLGWNDIYFKKPEFIEAFHTDKETDANIGFVRALKNVF
jgi:hypothetical protein